jgi:hypothetical protein
MVFMENVLLMCKVDRNTGDCHSQINFESYEKWLRKKCIPNLTQISVIVHMNKSYHSVLCECTPSSNTRKAIMIN